MRAVLKVNLFPGIDQRYCGIVYLLLVPLAIGNIDIGQANPLMAGLFLLAIAAVRVQRWNSAALCVTVAALFKLYPISIGLLICLIAPKRFGWRLLTAILVHCFIYFRSRFDAIGGILVRPFDRRSGAVV